MEPLTRSRLVGRGDLEKGIENLRSDSPTCDIEAQNLIFSFAATHCLVIKSVDITNAYFQGEEQDRLMILRQPPGGILGLHPNTRMLARVPIYGTKDAGRKFWKKLRRVFVDAGFRENRIFKALYAFTNAQGKLVCLLGTHVDDILWANFPEVDHIIAGVLSKFQCGDPEMNKFRYCGKEVVQYEDFSIVVTCRATTDKLKPIRVESGRKASDPLNDSEKTQMKSVAGSLQWISRQARPELSYRTSKIQQLASSGTVSDIKYANKVVRYAMSTADRGLTFKPGMVDWDAMCSVVITDASHTNEVAADSAPKG